MMKTNAIRGIYRDILRDKKNRPLYDSGWRSNLIVLRCRVLLASLMMNDSPLGIQQVKIGIGDASWDETPPAAADPDTTTDLVDAAPFIISVADLTLEYLQPNGEPVENPDEKTNYIQATIQLDPGDPPPISGSVYPMREFGLFGDLNGEEYMLDYIVHPVIEKHELASLERKVRLLF